ncbi:MAG: hypothetical protein AAGD07_23225 [Planctomycetota bacterium]
MFLSARLTVLVIPLSVFHAAAVVASAEEQKSDNQETAPQFAASLLAGLLASNSSMRSYDVTYTSEFMRLHPINGLKCRDRKCRLAYDEDEKRGVFVRWSLIDAIPETDTPRNHSDLSAFYFDDSEELFHLSALGRKRVKLGKTQNVALLVGAPRLLSMGLVAFPDTMKTISDDDPIWANLTIPSRDMVARAESSDIARVVRRKLNGDKPENETIWLFSLETLLPVKRSSFYYHTVTGKRYLKEVEDFQWTTCNGHYVPSRIRRETNQRARVSDTDIRQFSDIHETHFRWLSVNETLPDELLDWKAIRTVQEIRDLLVD